MTITDTVGYLTEEGSRKSRRFFPGTVVIANSGWKCGVAKILGFECCGNDGIAALNELFEFDPRFICYWINSQTEILRAKAAAGNEQPNLNTDRIAALQVPAPPISEQKAIAEVLLDIDGTVDEIECLLAKKRDVRIGAMQSLIRGEQRLPGFDGDWEVKPLGDVVPIKKGQLITSHALKPGTVPVIAGGKQPAYFHASANRFGRTVTISASGASAGFVALHNEPIFASDCSTISEAEDYCLDYIYYQMLHEQQTIYEAQTGGAQPHINPKDLSPLLFRFPSILEQEAIAQVITDMDAEITALEARLEKTRALKQGMMQALLTGRVRLPVQAEALDALEVAHA